MNSPPMSSHIESIEEELKLLSEKKAKPWQRISLLLISVADSGLFKPQFENFTQWLKHLATETGMHESSFWRYYKAGDYYLEKTGKGLESLVTLGVSPKKLELVSKIEEHDTELGRELFEAVVVDDPKATMKALTEVWETIKSGKTSEQSKSDELRPLAKTLVEQYRQMGTSLQGVFFEELINAVVHKGQREILDRAVAICKTKIPNLNSH